MTGNRLWTLAIGAAVALSGTANSSFAQTAKSTATQKVTTKATDSVDPKEAVAKVAFMDPAAQLRMLRRVIGVGQSGGPWGGRGGSQGGGGILGLLLQSPTLQEEIDLTEQQKTALKKVGDDTQKKQRELFASMRGNNGGGRGNFDPQVMENIRTTMTEMQQTSDQTISKILKKDQKARLNQIALQIEGPQAIAKEEIGNKLKLMDEQFEQVKGIVAEMRTQQGDIMQQGMQQARTLFGGMGGPGGRNGQGGAAAGGNGQGNQANTKATATKTSTTKATVPKDGSDDEGEAAPAPAADTKAAAANNGGRGNRPDPNDPVVKAARQKMTDAMTKLEKESSKIEAQAELMILKTLSKPQKALWARMLGAKMDLLKIVIDRGNRAGPGGGGPGGPGGGGPGGPGGPGGAPKGDPNDN